MSQITNDSAMPGAADIIAAANDALAPFLREQEEAKHLALSRKPGARQHPKFRSSASTSRWALPVDFCYPSALTDRTPLPNGRVSFHFNYETVTKRVSITYGGKSIHPLFDAPLEAAVRHAVYIEREDAVELGRQISRDALFHTEEGLEDAGADGSTVLVRSVFSNISEEYWERIEFWKLIEELEESPTLHNIYFNPGSNSEWWIALEANTGFEPAILRTHALTVQRAYDEHLEAGGDARQFAAKPLQLTIRSGDPRIDKRRKAADQPELGYALWQAVHGLPFDDQDPPLRVDPDRAGRMQIRMIGRLPHDLSPEDRAEIVHRFGDHLATLETRKLKSGKTATIGLMYTAVVHHPTHHNDPRNFHFHVVAHDWPAWQDDCGDWNFAESIVKMDDSGRSSVEYPLREGKVKLVSQGRNASGDERAGNKFIKHLREKLADICNDVLIRRKKKQRYDPRRYAEMKGVERQPTVYLGGPETALVEVGVSTFRSRLNGAIIWNYEQRLVEQRIDEREAAHRIGEAMFISARIWASDFPAGDPHVVEMERLRDEHAALVASVSPDRRAIDLLEHREKKARSTAMHVVRICDRYLSAGSRTAEAQIRRHKEAITRRRSEAKAHLAQIDAALAPHRQVLRDLKTDVQKREFRILQINREWEIREPSMKAEWGRLRSAPLAPSPRLEAALPLISAPSGEIQPSRQSPAPIHAGDQPDRENDGHRPTTTDPSPALDMRQPEAQPDASGTHAPAPTYGPVTSLPPSETAASERAGKLLDESDESSISESAASLPEQPKKERPAGQAPRLTETRGDTLPMPPEPASGQPRHAAKTLQSRPQVEASSPETSGSNADASSLTPVTLSDDERPTADEANGAADSAAEPAASEPSIAACARAQGNQAGHDAGALAEREDSIPSALSREAAAKPENRPPQRPTESLRDVVRQRDPGRRPAPQRAVSQAITPDVAKPRRPSGKGQRDLDWIALLQRIRDRQIRVRTRALAAGGVVYEVPALTSAEQALLASKGPAEEAKQLARIHQQQQAELTEIVTWIKVVGRYAKNLNLDGGGILIQGAKERVQTLLEAWWKEPEVGAAIDAERARREALDAEYAALEGRPGRAPSRSFAERQSEACAALPRPEQMSQPPSFQFVEMLRVGALRKELGEAAEAVDENPLARAELLSSTSLLRAQFKLHEPPPRADVFGAYRGRGGTGIR